MSEFAELMRKNHARLVVMYREAPDGSEQFQWGIVGHIPILSLIGYVSTTQAALGDAKWLPEPDGGDSALVIAWDADGHSADILCSQEIPRQPLIGMLEVIKATLVGTRLAQMAVAQQRQVVGLDGRPAEGIR